MISTFRIVSIALLALTLYSAVSANELVNGSFETGSLSGWSQSVTGGGSWDYPANEAVDGAKPARWVKGFYDFNSPENKIWQTITTTPGLYNITFSGWIKRYALNKINASQPGWVYATIELLTDNNVIWSKTVNGTGGTNGWETFTYTTPVPIQISGNKTARLKWGLTQEGIYNTKYYDVVQADGWDLQSTAVPEPASMLVLAGSLLGLVITRKK